MSHTLPREKGVSISPALRWPGPGVRSAFLRQEAANELFFFVKTVVLEPRL